MAWRGFRRTASGGGGGRGEVQGCNDDYAFSCSFFLTGVSYSSGVLELRWITPRKAQELSGTLKKSTSMRECWTPFTHSALLSFLVFEVWATIVFGSPFRGWHCCRNEHSLLFLWKVLQRLERTCANSLLCQSQTHQSDCQRLRIPKVATVR